MEDAGAKWKSIADSLAERIRSGEWSTGQRIPTEEEVAKQWGVSRPTAHRALAELQREGIVVRQRRHGTVVADQTKPQTHLIALIFDHIAKAFDFPQTELIQGIQQVLGEEYSVIWCDSMDDPHREANFLRRMAKESDGIILFPIADPVNTPLMHSLHASGVPLVLLDRLPEGFDGCAVLSEDRDTTRESIHLLSKHGHKNIGFFGFYKPNVSSAIGRYEGYLQGMKEIGVEDTSRFGRWFVRQLEHEPDLFRQAIYDCVYTLTHGDDRITAAYCMQDCFAAELVRCCEEFGLSIPGDLEVVVVNEWPEHLLPCSNQMHRIVRRKREIGVTAAQKLLRIRSKEPDDDIIFRIPARLHIVGAPDSSVLTGLLAAQGTNGG